MRKPKFKIGDVLQPIVEETNLVKFHVVEIHTQICEAGIEQIFYSCRIYTKHYAGAAAGIARDLFLFNEMEVKLWKEKKE